MNHTRPRTNQRSHLRWTSHQKVASHCRWESVFLILSCLVNCERGFFFRAALMSPPTKHNSFLFFPASSRSWSWPVHGCTHSHIFTFQVIISIVLPCVCMISLQYLTDLAPAFFSLCSYLAFRLFNLKNTWSHFFSELSRCFSPHSWPSFTTAAAVGPTMHADLS